MADNTDRGKLYLIGVVNSSVRHALSVASVGLCAEQVMNARSKEEARKTEARHAEMEALMRVSEWQEILGGREDGDRDASVTRGSKS